jgi:23S rRNA pseudouridine1911/1915/1917 synthase
MHTAPLREYEATLLHWAAKTYPDILQPRGRIEREGGLVHRLDYETQGLVLIARTQEGLDAFRALQEKGGILKTYEAFSAGPAEKADSAGPPVPPGFPPFPAEFAPAAADGSAPAEFRIESAFRSYGPGAKQVRPVWASHYPSGSNPAAESAGKIYRTEGAAFEGAAFGKGRFFVLRLTKGFRHQIRAHLAWARWPLLNDALYGGKCGSEKTGTERDRPGENFLALRACAISFIDPVSGIRTELCL